MAASPRRADLESTLATCGHRLPGRRARARRWPWPTPSRPSTCSSWCPRSRAAALLSLVQNAGAVFIGDWSPASMGDYIAGPNHVLPTNRTARFASALRADDFRKHVHAGPGDAGRAALARPAVVTLAETEGLPAHADSVRRALADLADDSRWAWRTSERRPAGPARSRAGRGLPLAPGRGRGAAQHERVALRAARRVARRSCSPRWPTCPSTATRTGRPPSCARPWPTCTGCTPEEVFCANGSNEVLQCLLLAFGGPGRRALLFEPTYALHSHIARITGTEVVEGGRDDDFRIDPGDAVALLGARAARRHVPLLAEQPDRAGRADRRRWRRCWRGARPGRRRRGLRAVLALDRPRPARARCDGATRASS